MGKNTYARTFWTLEGTEERERETERDRERQRQRDRDRDRERQRERETERVYNCLYDNNYVQ